MFLQSLKYVSFSVFHYKWIMLFHFRHKKYKNLIIVKHYFVSMIAQINKFTCPVIKHSMKLLY